ncbi:hypothetical protein [Paralcaligenes ureilyticus]|uniref:Uncharacterized protein n=1 Tax=Paralcaligenes ureilyticus TaxID=627131 RepID=A0A4R3M8E6_9BURK|nr:hypothetical protein [Paralcaligenes ureilyticus]TCT09650.1 hypothetical protein EDC26_103269 [Paralcaligenes ureilyticus]
MIETFDSSNMPTYLNNLIDDEYGLTPIRIAEIAANTAVMGKRVMSLAQALSFEAEPWGFGAELLRLAKSDET